LINSIQFFLRTDASESTGMGHFIRCLALAKKIIKAGFKVNFIFKYVTEKVLKILKEEHISFLILSEDISWSEETSILQKRIPKNVSSILILDNAHLKSFSQLEGYAKYTSLLGSIFKGIVLIDGYKKTSFVETEIDLDIDLIITPYHGEVPKIDHLSNVTSLSGAKYIVFKDDFCRFYNKKKKISEKASKVLVTFGGSDPHNITPYVLKGISNITDRILEVVIVIGPNFSKSLKQKIHLTIADFEHQWKLVEAPDSMASWIKWADVAISATGLTKYELALLGTPGIFLSIDMDHLEMNSSFETVETGLNLGIYDSVTKDQIKESLVELLENQSMRMTMAENGMALVDCDGSKRILDAIKMEIINVKN